MSSSRSGIQPGEKWDLVSPPFTLRRLETVTFKYPSHLPRRAGTPWAPYLLAKLEKGIGAGLAHLPSSS